LYTDLFERTIIPNHDLFPGVFSASFRP
jgi:hypothetical protein